MDDIKEKDMGMSKEAAEKKPDWALIKAEYLVRNISISQIAEKYSVSKSAVSKKCAKEKWTEQRQKMQEKAAEKIAKELNDKNVKETVREIDRVVKVAGKLISKLNRAVNELDKKEQIINKLTTMTVNENTNDEGTEVVETNQAIKIEREKYKTLVDTKKAEQISKSLLNIKEILTDYSVIQENDEKIGIIEIPQQIELNPPQQQELDSDE